MGKGIEAYRAAVHAWECDAVEHFTTAYYLHKISSSAMRMLIELGYAADDPLLPTTRYFYGNFSNELHKGDESQNILPVTVELVREGATMGDIVENLKGIWGTYRETPVF